MSRSQPQDIAGRNGTGLESIASHSTNNEDRHAASSLSDALARSVECSFLLKGRSPWISGQSSSIDGAASDIEHNRARSLSFASSIDNVASNQSSVQSVHRAMAEAADDAAEPLLRSQARGGGSERYIDPITGEDLGSIADFGFASVRSYGQAHSEDPPTLSSLSQSVFNATNLLMGVGLLSLPYALRLSGWIPGIGMLILFSALTNHTAKLIGRMMEYTPVHKLREGPGAYTMFGFHDMAQVAFGLKGTILVSILFIGETFGYACLYMIIEAQNLMQVLGKYQAFDGWELHHFMCLASLIFLPTMLLRNLSILSYFSAAGMVASLSLLVGVTVDGLTGAAPNSDTCTPPDCTGSILNPSATELIKFDSLGVVSGIVMVGFAGHAVFPTLRNDMRDKKQYNAMVDITYTLVCSAYLSMSIIGYLMFGQSTLQQITLNLGSNVVSQMTVWVVVANPITKFALDMAPIALGAEAFFQVLFKLPPTGLVSLLVSVVLRTLLTACALAVVIAVSDFALMMGILGSMCSFTISVSLPSAAYVVLFWGELSPFSKAMNTIIAVFGVCGAVVGTYCAVVLGGEGNAATLDALNSFLIRH